MRANGSHAPLTTKIDIHDKEGRKIGEKEVVTYAGILALAHDEGLRSIITKLVQVPTKENGTVAIVTAVVRTHRGVFTAIGDANPGNVNRKIAAHIIRMAETRAKARALRDAVDIGTVALEELGELVEDELSAEPTSQSDRPPAPPRAAAAAQTPATSPANDNRAPVASGPVFAPMTDAQRRMLFRLATERGIAPENANAWLLGQLKVSDLRALSRSTASEAIDRLKNSKPNGAGGNGASAGVV
ncbi:MAG: hypothetical protein WBP56_20685 [Polyangia bacterium]